MIKTVLQHPITKVIISTIAIILSVVIVKELITKPFLSLFITSEHVMKIIGSSVSTIVIVISYYFLLTRYFKRPFNEFPIKKIVPELGGGLLFGFSAIGVVILVLYLLGYYEITGFNDFYTFIPSITFLAGGVILEEIIFRGLLFKTLETLKGTIFAVLVSSVVFQLPHFMNPHEAFLPALLGFIFGIAHALMYAYTKRLWLPFAFHMGWNLAQPFFGSTLSGIDGFENLIVAQINGPELLTGSAFGVEDSLLTMAVLAALSLFFYYLLRKKGIIVKYIKSKKTV